MAGGWNSSSKFRYNAKKMCAHLDKQEKRWRAIVEAKVHTFTPEEIIAYAQKRGVGVAQSVLKEAR